VKFADLKRVAEELGADCLATGHYVQRLDGEAGPELHRAADPSRDQTYFLFATTRPQLQYLRFPLGGLPKTQVRELAAELGLRVAEKPDSQDICFVPNGKYQAVVEKLRPGAIEPGDIVHVDGRVMGRHDGVINFTVGQRRGLGVATGEPLFVVKLDAAAKRVIVGPREALGVTRIALKDVNWIGEAAASEDDLDGRPVLVRVRSTRPPVPGKLRVGAGWCVDLDEAEEGVAPGQAAVFYDPGSTRVLGGGWIARAQ
jgi:tRNA-specific 2-thiouridylase